MKLLRVQLINLYETFNHDIGLNQDERITILTAPNGYGKTIALKTIYSLFNNKFTFFTKLVFDKIIFTFDNNDTLEIIKKEKRIELILKENNKKPISFIYPSKEVEKEIRHNIPSHIIEDFTPPFIRRVGADRWLNELSGERLVTEEILEQYNDMFPEHILERINGKIPKELSRFLKVMTVYFIQEQRLILRQPISEHRIRREVIITDTIEKYSNEFSHMIGELDKEYGQITQSLDNSFPKRLFGENSDISTSDELKNKLKNLEKKRQKISEYGLLKVDDDSSFIVDENINESEKKALSLYIADNETKLSIFDTLMPKIELFTQILNERRFNFKFIKIDKERGFIFKTTKGDILELTDLSSGEQHEVVLLFELLFKAKENSLVLIDEPEISLHVVWQKAFLKDIEEIIKLQKIDIVIATHSPFIIDDRWDLTVNLEESEIVK